MPAGFSVKSTSLQNHFFNFWTASMRNIYPNKYYSDEGFVEYKLEINDEDLDEIIYDYLRNKAIQGELDFDFDEVEVVNNRPMNIWLYAKCRRFLDPDLPAEDQVDDAEVEVSGEYDDNDPQGLNRW